MIGAKTSLQELEDTTRAGLFGRNEPVTNALTDV